MSEVAAQLRLFPAAQPLVDRLGADFFRQLPQSPGVYRLMDASGSLLYVGKAGNLRARLSSYRRTRNQSRKTIRLIHQAHTIQWEVCSSEAAARLRENELLRNHRPKFNRAGTWPHGRYVRLNADSNHLKLSLLDEPTSDCFGAFRSQVQVVLQAIGQCLWLKLENSTNPASLPYSLTHMGRCHDLEICRSGVESWHPRLIAYFSGHADELTEALIPHPEHLPNPFEQAYHAAQKTIISEFFVRGPSRIRHWRRQFPAAAPWVKPEELDDLPILSELAAASQQGGMRS